jgi:hypothetical protein
LSKLTAVKKTFTLRVKNTTIATMKTSTGSDPTSPAFSASHRCRVTAASESAAAGVLLMRRSRARERRT